MRTDNLDIATLNRLFNYDPITGRLIWLQRGERDCPDPRERARWNGRYAGKEAFGIKPNGYREGMIFRVQHRAHRVAWAMFYGEWPQDDIDHINGDRADNRIGNLRVATRSENSRNTKLRCTNSSGRVGVSQRRGKWRATIRANNRQHELGIFDTFEEAAAARDAAEIRFGYHPNHGRVSPPALADTGVM